MLAQNEKCNSLVTESNRHQSFPLLDSRIAFGTMLTNTLGERRCKGLLGKAFKNCRLWNSQMRTGKNYFMSVDAIAAFKER